MKYSHRLSDAIHILVFVVINADGDLSSQSIADSIQSNPSLVRRLMSRLVKAELLVSRPGRVAPHLARPANTITLLEIYRATEDNQELLHLDRETNPRYMVGRLIQDTLASTYSEIQAAAEAKMAQISLQDIVDDLLLRNDQERKQTRGIDDRDRI
ncbi:Rrf2 family transcriptional regulator [Lapidilactobacillus mulanensis]|uniref:Rrf2 family transcriptional regulator n=1 Tax=Lapidilactobacillus mulanensis TaxID=2485999 RepID=A0ABW4DLS6_9LACO